MKNWLNIVNAGSETAPAEIVVSGPIGDNFWDDTATSAKQFRDALNSVPRGRKINLKINSEGGVIKDGLDMYDAVRSRRDDITAQVIGYGCSTGSWFFLPAGKVVTSDNALWMIHKSSCLTYGNEEDHAKQTAALKKHDESIAGMIAQKTGKSVSAVMEAMSSETWFTGKEAKDWGLADEVVSEAQNVASGVAMNIAPFAGDREHVKTQIKNFAAAPQGTKPTADAGGASGDSPDQPTPPTANANQPTAIAASISNAKGGEGSTADAATNQPNKGPEMITPTAAAPNPPAIESAAPVAQPEPQNILDLRTQVSDLQLEINRIKNQPLNNRASVAVIGDAHDKLIDLKTEGLEGDALTAQVNKRHRHLVNAWSDVVTIMRRKTGKDEKENFQAFNGQIVNANTISATLTTALLSTTSYTVLQNKLAMLQALFLQVQTDRLKPKALVEVPKVTAGPTAQKNPTDWESGNCTVTNTEITVDEYSASQNLSNADLQNGSRMEWLTYITAISFCNKINDVITALLLAANYTGTVTTIGAAAFGPGDLPALLALIKNAMTKNLVLDGAYTARLVPTNTLGLPWSTGRPGYGFDKIVEHNRWTVAAPDASVVGFAADPIALPCASGLPIDPPGGNAAFNSLEVATIAPLNMQVQLASWIKPGTRVLWIAYDAMFGAQVGDASALYLIKSS